MCVSSSPFFRLVFDDDYGRWWWVLLRLMYDEPNNMNLIRIWRFSSRIGNYVPCDIHMEFVLPFGFDEWKWLMAKAHWRAYNRPTWINRFIFLRKFSPFNAQFHWIWNWIVYSVTAWCCSFVCRFACGRGRLSAYKFFRKKKNPRKHGNKMYKHQPWPVC